MPEHNSITEQGLRGCLSVHFLSGNTRGTYHVGIQDIYHQPHRQLLFIRILISYIQAISGVLDQRGHSLDDGTVNVNHPKGEVQTPHDQVRLIGRRCISRFEHRQQAADRLGTSMPRLLYLADSILD